MTQCHIIGYEFHREGIMARYMAVGHALPERSTVLEPVDAIALAPFLFSFTHFKRL